MFTYPKSWSHQGVLLPKQEWQFAPRVSDHPLMQETDRCVQWTTYVRLNMMSRVPLH